MSEIHVASEIAIIVQTIILFLAAWFAYRTIQTTERENRRWNTLNICAKYELNENVVKANDSLYAAFHKRGNGKPDENECKALQRPAIIVLNFLDGIAIGVSQGLYIEELAKDHLKTIVNGHVQNLLESDCARLLDLDRKDFHFLTAMNEKWREDKPYFQA